MSTDAGSTRVSILARRHALVALVVATASLAVGVAPAAAATGGSDNVRGKDVRTEIGQPASVVVNRVERSIARHDGRHRVHRRG